MFLTIIATTILVVILVGTGAFFVTAIRHAPKKRAFIYGEQPRSLSTIAPDWIVLGDFFVFYIFLCLGLRIFRGYYAGFFRHHPDLVFAATGSVAWWCAIAAGKSIRRNTKDRGGELDVAVIGAFFIFTLAFIPGLMLVPDAALARLSADLGFPNRWWILGTIVLLAVHLGASDLRRWVSTRLRLRRWRRTRRRQDPAQA